MNRRSTLAPAALAPATLAMATLAAAALTTAVSAVPVEEAWIDRLDGPASMNDYGDAVAIGANGSVYVAGLVFEEVSASYFAPRFMTIKYDASGARTWTQTYHGTFASGAAAAEHIAIDGAGDILVSGSTNQGDDWAILKYDPDGNELWRTVYEAASTFLTTPAAMALDAAGNAYLVGYVGDHLNPNAGVVVKVAPDGVIAWAKRYYGPIFDGAFFNDVAVDDAGNVYAAGGTAVSGLATEIAVVKYDAAGVQQWLATHGSASSFAHDRANAVALDGGGNVVVAGALANVDIALLKLDGAGKRLWNTTYQGAGGGTDAVTDLAVDSTGAIVLAGYTYVASNDYAAMTLKYDASGAFAWERRVAGEEIYFDWAAALTLDQHDNIYVAGEYDPIGGSRYFTVRYDPGGTEAWFMDYAGPLGGGSGARAIAVGADGSVAVTGDSPDVGTDLDIATIRYEQTPTGVTGDVTGDGVVDFTDLLALLAAWGPCGDCADCPADFDESCDVGFSDLILLLASWS